jgi:hypothetical protein
MERLMFFTMMFVALATLLWCFWLLLAYKKPTPVYDEQGDLGNICIKATLSFGYWKERMSRAKTQTELDYCISRYLLASQAVVTLSGHYVPPDVTDDMGYIEGAEMSAAETLAKSVGYWEGEVNNERDQDKQSAALTNLRISQRRLMEITRGYIPEEAKVDRAALQAELKPDNTNIYNFN